MTRELKLDMGKPTGDLQKSKVPRFTGTQAVERGIELTNAKNWVYEYWKANPDVTPTQVHKALKDETGEIVSPSTIGSWLLRMKRKMKRRGLPGEPISQMPQKPSSKLTWEDILQAVPNRIELASLVLDGFTKVIADERQRNSELLKELDTASETITNLSEQVEAITEDRKRLMQQHNELISKTRSGDHFTLDETKQILVPRQR